MARKKNAKTELTKAEAAAAAGNKQAELDASHLRPDADPKDERLLKTKGVVARGKTVVNEHGKFTQGMIVTSSPDEIARLRKLKFLVDPRENLLPMGHGPKFFQEDKASEGVREP